MKYTIDFCKGTNGGHAIYANTKSGGTRLFGPKCWGYINTLYSIPLTENNLNNAIKELQRIKEEISK